MLVWACSRHAGTPAAPADTGAGEDGAADHGWPEMPPALSAPVLSDIDGSRRTSRSGAARPLRRNARSSARRVQPVRARAPRDAVDARAGRAGRVRGAVPSLRAAEGHPERRVGRRRGAGPAEPERHRGAAEEPTPRWRRQRESPGRWARRPRRLERRTMPRRIARGRGAGSCRVDARPSPLPRRHPLRIQDPRRRTRERACLAALSYDRGGDEGAAWRRAPRHQRQYR